MRPWLAVAIVCACAPTGQIEEVPPGGGEQEFGSETPLDLCGNAAELGPTMTWPACEQHYGRGSAQHPFVWETSSRLDPDHPCRFGCTMTSGVPDAATPGMATTLHPDGDITIRSSGPQQHWERRLGSSGFTPKQVRWTSWCGDAMVLAAHDERFVRVVALSSTTGEVLDELEQRFGTWEQPDPSFDVQLTCWDFRTAVHVLGRGVAWSLDMPRIDAADGPRRLAPDVIAHLFAKDGDEAKASSKRELLRTRTRVYHRVGDEVFALDASGAPLWHREASDGWVGCLQGSQLMGIIAASSWPPRQEKLSLVGESVVLEVYDSRSSTDVFDADGKHLAYLAR